MRGLGFSLALGATLTLLSIGCGRSDLDQPFDASASGEAGSGGHTARGGVGGTSSGGGQGGSGGVSGVRGGSPGRAGAGGIVGTGSAGSAGKKGSLAGSGGGAAGATGTAGASGNSDGGLGGAAATNGGGTGGIAGSSGIGGTGATGAAGIGGTGGMGGTGGIGATGGMGVPPVPITCGLQTCAAGAQTCCIQSSGGVTTESCVKTGTSCPGGATIGCLDGAACSDGNICCLSVLNASTACESVQTCTGGVGLILCAGDGDCPTGSPRCCRAGRIGFCRPGLCL